MPKKALVTAIVTGARQPFLDVWARCRHLRPGIHFQGNFMNGLRVALLGSCVAFVGIASTQAAVVVPIAPVANATSTTAFAINDDNVVAGSFLDQDGVEHAFFGTPDGDYAAFDAGAGGTEARGIGNDGTIVGMSNSQSGETAAQPIFERKQDGTLSNITRAGVQLFGSAQQIDNSDGKFAGTYWDFTNHQAVAFVGQNGKWRSDVKISEVHQASAARGIDAADDVVGSYFRPPMHGYLVSNKVLTTLDYPVARDTATEIEGINDHGQAVGQWMDKKGVMHSFLLDIATNSFTDIKVKGATQVQAWAINNNGVVVLNSDLGPYLWCAKKRACQVASAPVRRLDHP